MNKKKLFTAAAALFTFTAVSTIVLLNHHKQDNASATESIESEKTEMDLHNAENSLDYWGSYSGTFPAADCPGIEMTLVLKKEKRFELTMNYVDRNITFSDQGDYTVTGNILTLIGQSTDYYRIGENLLRKLDSDKQPITGDLANHYLLIKSLE